MNISIHALLAESDTLLWRRQKLKISISIHALLAESDCVGVGDTHLRVKFLSTLSLRRATMQDIPTDLWQIISIHALLAESDGNCP